MNEFRLNSIVNLYINKFDFLTQTQCDENMKWRAIHHFQTHFDLEAHNFHDMFKEAMSESRIIINNGIVQPINGILRLILHEEETMRKLFAMLYEDDGGNIDKRQIRIERFVDETNKLLDKYERGKWKYKQDFRSVLAYLTFYQPDQNYLYKSSQCQPFFRYLEFGEEIGYGQYFKLSRYYRMCDEVKKSLSQMQELMTIHNNRLLDIGYPHSELNILTFDIIYCSIVYGFYKYADYLKIVRKSKNDLAQENIEAEIEVKRCKLEYLKNMLCEIQNILDDIPDISIEGQNVKHKLFGNGTVIKQRGSIIEVTFATKTTKFVLTTSFVDGFLSSEDPSVLEQCKKLESTLTNYNKI